MSNAAKAMQAIETALAPTAEELAVTASVASALAEERRRALAVLNLHFAGQDQGREVAIDALDTLASQIDHMIVPDDEGLGWDEDGLPSCDENELEEARRRANCGQIDDCLHHLERALPEGYGFIAERLADHFRSR